MELNRILNHKKEIMESLDEKLKFIMENKMKKMLQKLKSDESDEKTSEDDSVPQEQEGETGESIKQATPDTRKESSKSKNDERDVPTSGIDATTSDPDALQKQSVHQQTAETSKKNDDEKNDIVRAKSGKTTQPNAKKIRELTPAEQARANHNKAQSYVTTPELQVGRVIDKITNGRTNKLPTEGTLSDLMRRSLGVGVTIASQLPQREQDEVISKAETSKALKNDTAEIHKQTAIQQAVNNPTPPNGKISTKDLKTPESAIELVDKNEVGIESKGDQTDTKARMIARIGGGHKDSTEAIALQKAGEEAGMSKKAIKQLKRQANASNMRGHKYGDAKAENIEESNNAEEIIKQTMSNRTGRAVKAFSRRVNLTPIGVKPHEDNAGATVTYDTPFGKTSFDIVNGRKTGKLTRGSDNRNPQGVDNYSRFITDEIKSSSKEAQNRRKTKRNEKSSVDPIGDNVDKAKTEKEFNDAVSNLIQKAGIQHRQRNNESYNLNALDTLSYMLKESAWSRVWATKGHGNKAHADYERMSSAEKKLADRWASKAKIFPNNYGENMLLKVTGKKLYNSAIAQKNKFAQEASKEQVKGFPKKTMGFGGTQYTTSGKREVETKTPVEGNLKDINEVYRTTAINQRVNQILNKWGIKKAPENFYPQKGSVINYETDENGNPQIASVTPPSSKFDGIPEKLTKQQPTPEKKRVKPLGKTVKQVKDEYEKFLNQKKAKEAQRKLEKQAEEKAKAKKELELQARRNSVDKEQEEARKQDYITRNSRGYYNYHGHLGRQPKKKRNYLRQDSTKPTKDKNLTNTDWKDFNNAGAFRAESVTHSEKSING